MATLALKAVNPPLKQDADGVIRVRASRVTLDSVVGAFSNGATAEEIAHQYPSLSLADIYSAISYVLNHQDEVEHYLEQRRAEREALKQSNESRFDPSGIRDRLLARRRSK